MKIDVVMSGHTIFHQGKELMRERRADTENQKISQAKLKVASNGLPPTDSKAAVALGRPLEFEKALAASMAKFDAALHRLAK